MMDNRLASLKQIMELEFTVVELNLFLDTHPHCQQALEDYRMTNDRLFQLIQNYESKFGPLFVFSNTCAEEHWRWIDEPWPWEIDY